PVAALAADLFDAVFPEHRAAVTLARPLPTKGPDPTVRPSADNQILIFRVHASDRLAAGAHDGVQGLNAVDAVPVKIGMVRLQLARTVGVGPENAPDLAGP